MKSCVGSVLAFCCWISLSSASLIRLVSKCTTNTGVGRCTSLPSSCMDVGGIVADELQFPNGEKPLDFCPDDEICCLLPALSQRETCQTCGVKGVNRISRKSNLERSLDNSDEHRHRLRALREVEQDSNYVDTQQRNSLKMSRIMNGDNAQKNEWCWQVALLNVDGTVAGSGSLVDGRYVLTAAHKVAGKNASNLVVLVGQYDFANPVGADGMDDTVWYAKPLEIIIHEHYNPDTLDNDVAMVRIPMVSCDTANVCPVCLNSISPSPDSMSTFMNCYITGWGATIARDTSTVLQEARVKILTMPECLQRFSSLGLLDVQLPPSVFCAEGTPPPFRSGNDVRNGLIMSTCSGDGGGPLVCESPDGIWRLMGMIAMGLDECKRTRVAAPTVFVNVGMYVDWVHKIRRKNNPVEVQNALSESVKILNGQKDSNRQPKAVDATTTASILDMIPHRSIFGRSL